VTQAQYIQGADVVDYTPDADVAAGAVVVLGDLVGVAKHDIKANQLGALAIEGVFDMVKASATVITLGASVYWDATNSVVVTTATGNKYLGRAILAAASGETVVRVRVST
jgi:predicted RecA/RadA family phage recombinase